MKGLYKAIGVGIVSVPLLLGGCKKEATPEWQYMKLQGIVINETYVPRNTGSFIDPVVASKYSFSMKTENGTKAVQVKSTREISKETINSLVDPKLKVEIEIEKGNADNQVYSVPANKIRVLE